MIVLDTDHLSVLAFPDSDAYETLSSRIIASAEEFATSIVCVEEQLRGWLAYINGKKDVSDQVIAYDELAKLWAYFRDWKILLFDSHSADLFKNLRKQKIRIGSRDLKIAASAVTHNALLLSANLRDFRQVPGLRVENWLVS